MLKEWYELKFTRDENCKLSKKVVASLLNDRLKEVDYKLRDAGNKFESSDWGCWETMISELCVISRKLPGVLLIVTSEAEDCDCANTGKFQRHYFKDGQTNSVFGNIAYPEYQGPPLDYIHKCDPDKIVFGHEAKMIAEFKEKLNESGTRKEWQDSIAKAYASIDFKKKTIEKMDALGLYEKYLFELDASPTCLVINDVLCGLMYFYNMDILAQIETTKYVIAC